MDRNDQPAERFEEQRSHLWAVAYRMLGSRSEAEDAVQEGWLRASRADTNGVENLGGWLTTVVARVCLNMLRARSSRLEGPLEDERVPELVLSSHEGDPEEEALMADSVGLAMLVVLDTLSPAERLAFVLHDMFSVPFEGIATIVGRSEAATRQLASRARRRVRTAPTEPDADLGRQREVADAYLAAARDGDFDALVAVLDPDVVLRSDGGADHPELSTVLRGVQAVARGAVAFSRLPLVARPVLVNGSPGFIALQDGRLFSVLGLTIRGGKVVEMHVLRDPDRLASLDLTALGVDP
jgi:RNA polymerase sigma factor (sigma-70 family)